MPFIHTRVNRPIAKEKEKVIVPISKEDVLEFINTTLKEEPEMLIRVLVKKILIYDDNVFDTLKINSSKHCETCKKLSLL